MDPRDHAARYQLFEADGRTPLAVVPLHAALAGDPVEGVARLKEESDVPLRSHGSLQLNRALMGAGLVPLPQSVIRRRAVIRLAGL